MSLLARSLSPPASPARPGRRIAAVLLIVFGILLTFALRPGRAPQASPGGRFVGEIPGLGPVQLDLWRHDRRWTAQWWSGPHDRPHPLWLNETSPGRFEGSIHERLSTQPAPAVRLVLDHQTLALEYVGPDTNAPARSAQLHQSLAHLSITGQAGFRAGKWGARKRFSGVFPALDLAQPFQRAVQDRMRAETVASAEAFLAGSLRHQWDALRLLWPAGMRHGFEWTEWQPHLVSTQLVSLAVWSYRQSGGAGNWNRWTTRNFWWNGTHSIEFALPDLFPPAANWENDLRRRCHEDLHRQQASGANAVLSTNDVPLRSFCLTPRHLVLLFNPYEVGSGAEGEFRVALPRDQLQPLLRRDGPARAWLDLPPPAPTPR